MAEKHKNLKSNQLSMENLLQPHSIIEKHLYLMTQRCKNCGQKGTLDHIKHSLRVSADRKQHFDEETTRCRKCGHEEVFRFDVTSFFGNPAYYKGYVINLSDEPSHIIDIVDYTLLALFHFDILKKHLRQKDVSNENLDRLAKLAQGCINEALKFYRQSESLDEEKSLFSDENKKNYEKNKESYSFKYLRFQLSKINCVCNNLEAMKEIYGGLTNDPRKDIQYLRGLTDKYKENKEILMEIGRLKGSAIWETLPPEKKEEWKKLVERERPIWERFEY
jgi:hypothetical protein